MGRESGPRSTDCPDFLVSALAEAREVCADAGGHLAPGPQPVLTGIDVNGDGRREFLFRLDESVACEGAWSVFSCGSLGCPFMLYEERGSTWRPIGAIDADASESIALTGTARINGYFHGDTEVAIVGTAARGDYYYVSPCNACERGFVHKSDVLVRQ
ncbi:hypothetical protein ACG33_00995 [Steroidobacter denitrificans]|uniref:Uncharacterized protein n=2 Tax=Steroidobacter denitrificans TaxID=465721 RepID=A0A127F7Y0_STEDE|nr:hypothetical protein ACG33_00995 [Steroidobacter denitrificans]